MIPDLENQLLEQNRECSNNCNESNESILEIMCDILIQFCVVIFFIIIFLLMIFYIADFINSFF